MRGRSEVVLCSTVRTCVRCASTFGGTALADEACRAMTGRAVVRRALGSAVLTTAARVHADELGIGECATARRRPGEEARHVGMGESREHGEARCASIAPRRPRGPASRLPLVTSFLRNVHTPGMRERARAVVRTAGFVGRAIVEIDRIPQSLLPKICRNRVLLSGCPTDTHITSHATSAHSIARLSTSYPLTQHIIPSPSPRSSARAAAARAG